jgi:hypothetical protein
MRFKAIIFCCCFWVCPVLAEDGSNENYVLTIDGIDYPLALGAESTVKLKSGTEVPVTLKKNAFGRFATGGLSFEFPGQYTVASTVIDEDITQHIVVTGIGTMMLVQNYQGGIPSGLLDVMFDEMVEEPKAMGLNIERTDIIRTISGQAELKGVRAHYKGKGDDVTIDIVLAEAGDDGFMILTMSDALSEPDERPIIERFWESVALKNNPTP